MGTSSSKFEKHQLIQSLKDAASELGHTPSRQDYRSLNRSPSADNITTAFGGWSTAIQAAGLEPKKLEKKAVSRIELIDDSEKLSQIIRSTTERKIVELNHYKKIFCLPDQHWPYINEDAMTMVYYLLKKEKPDIVIQLGDLFDLYSFSRFPRSLNIHTPKAEWELARAGAVSMWKKIREIVPRAECYQLRGNHCIRADARIQEKLPEAEHLIKEVTARAFTFDGVTTIMCPQEEFFIKDIAFIHGHYSGMGKHRDYMKMNVVHGHDHAQYIVYKPSWNEKMQSKVIWEMSCGLLGDPFSSALTYRSQRMHQWTTGIGVIDEYGPRTIAF